MDALEATSTSALYQVHERKGLRGRIHTELS